MSTEAIALFTIAALMLAVVMILSSRRESRYDREETERARARAEKARLEAEVARREHAQWRERLALQREAILVGGDPRGLGDGMGRLVDATDRFRRQGALSDPTPSGRLRPRG